MKNTKFWILTTVFIVVVLTALGVYKVYWESRQPDLVLLLKKCGAVEADWDLALHDAEGVDRYTSWKVFVAESYPDR